MSQLTYMDHASDRMEQRNISAAEVEEVWGSGEVATPDALNGLIRFTGTTSAGRRLTVFQLPNFPVIVSVVEG